MIRNIGNFSSRTLSGSLLIALLLTILSHCSEKEIDSKTPDAVKLIQKEEKTLAEWAGKEERYLELVEEFKSLPTLHNDPEYLPITKDIETLLEHYFIEDGLDLCKFRGFLISFLDENTASPDLINPEICFFAFEGNEVYFRNLQLRINEVFETVAIRMVNGQKIIETPFTFILNFEIYKNDLLPHLKGSVELTLNFQILLSENNIELAVISSEKPKFTQEDDRLKGLEPLVQSLLANQIMNLLQSKTLLRQEINSNNQIPSFGSILGSLLGQTSSNEDIFELITQIKLIFNRLKEKATKIKGETNLPTGTEYLLPNEIAEQSTSTQSQSRAFQISSCKTDPDCMIKKLSIVPSSVGKLLYNDNGHEKNFLLPINMGILFNLNLPLFKKATIGSLKTQLVLSISVKKEQLEINILDLSIQDISLRDKNLAPFTIILKKFINTLLTRLIKNKSEIINTPLINWVTPYKTNIIELLGNISSQKEANGITDSIASILSIPHQSIYDKSSYHEVFAQITSNIATRDKLYLPQNENGSETKMDWNQILYFIEEWFSKGKENTPIDLTEIVRGLNAFLSKTINYLKIYPDFRIETVHSQFSDNEKEFLLPIDFTIAFSFKTANQSSIAGEADLRANLSFIVQKHNWEIETLSFTIMDIRSQGEQFNSLETPLKELFNRKLVSLILPYAETQLNEVLPKLEPYYEFAWYLLEDVNNNSQVHHLLHSYLYLLDTLSSNDSDSDFDQNTPHLVDSPIHSSFTEIKDQLTYKSTKDSEFEVALYHFIQLFSDMAKPAANPCAAVSHAIFKLKSCRLTPDFNSIQIYTPRVKKEPIFLIPLQVAIDFQLEKLLIPTEANGRVIVQLYLEIDLRKNSINIDLYRPEMKALELNNHYLSPLSPLFQTIANSTLPTLIQAQIPKLNHKIQLAMTPALPFINELLLPLDNDRRLTQFIDTLISLTGIDSVNHNFFPAFPTEELISLSYEELMKVLYKGDVPTHNNNPISSQNPLAKYPLLNVILNGVATNNCSYVTEFLATNEFVMEERKIRIKDLCVLPNIKLEKAFLKRDDKSHNIIIPISFFTSFTVEDLLLKTDVQVKTYINANIHIRITKDNIILTSGLNLDRLTFREPLFNEFRGIWQGLLNQILPVILFDKKLDLKGLFPEQLPKILQFINPWITTIQTQAILDKNINGISQLLHDLVQIFLKENPELAGTESKYHFQSVDQSQSYESLLKQLKISQQPSSDFTFNDFQAVLETALFYFKNPPQRSEINICQVLRDAGNPNGCRVTTQTGEVQEFSRVLITIGETLDRLLQNLRLETNGQNTILEFDLVVDLRFNIRDLYMWFDLLGVGTVTIPIKVMVKKKENPIIEIGEITITNWATNMVFTMVSWLTDIVEDTVRNGLNGMDRNELISNLNLNSITDIVQIGVNHIQTTEKLQQFVQNLQQIIYLLQKDIEQE